MKIHSFNKIDKLDDKFSNGMKGILKLNETKIHQLNATKIHQMHENESFQWHADIIHKLK